MKARTESLGHDVRRRRDRMLRELCTQMAVEELDQLESDQWPS